MRASAWTVTEPWAASGEATKRNTPAFSAGAKVFLLVAGGHAALRRQYPNLQEMRFTIRLVVELGVAHTRTSTHALHIPGGNAFDIAHVVLVGQIARQHVADDLHVLVAMGAKTGAWRDPVFVDHPQVAPTHELRVVVARKGKTVKRLQPTVVGVAPVL